MERLLIALGEARIRELVALGAEHPEAQVTPVERRVMPKRRARK
jgi:hypothetical protein